MIIPAKLGNHTSGLDHDMPSNEKSLRGQTILVGKNSFALNGKSNKIRKGQPSIAKAISLR